MSNKYSIVENNSSLNNSALNSSTLNNSNINDSLLNDDIKKNIIKNATGVNIDSLSNGKIKMDEQTLKAINANKDSNNTLNDTIKKLDNIGTTNNNSEILKKVLDIYNSFN